MTNAMNVLIKDPKNEQREIATVSRVESERRNNCICFYSILLSFAILCQLTLLLQIFTIDPSQDDSLQASWRRQVATGGCINEELAYTPEQLHLSLGANDSEAYVTWTTKMRTSCSLVYSLAPVCDVDTSDEIIVPASLSKRTFESTDEKWNRATGKTKRSIYTYRAKLENLEPRNLYIYRAQCNDYYSKTYQYLAKDLSNTRRDVRLAFYGDLGLENAKSIPRLIQDVDNNNYDIIIHNGDFAYDLNTHHGEYGDDFMRKIEPIAARVPYQTSVGNHEIAENFSHYDHRFTMVNSGGLTPGEQNNFYYSFDVGPVHFVAFSTEFYYFLDYVGIEALHNQYEWLKKDLSHASSPSERLKRPWIIVFGHRPMYCSSRDNDDCSKDSNILRKGLPFLGTYALEKLYYDYGVDVELYSHEHQYERFLPIFNGQVFNGTTDIKNPYNNPRAPVHIISGSAGCKERLDPFKGKAAAGSVKQISDYGYTRMTASPCKLLFEQISDDQWGTVVDKFTVSKDEQNFPQKSDVKFNCKSEPVELECRLDHDQSCLKCGHYPLF